MSSAYILAAYRTPGCRANKGKFKDMRPDDLAAAAIRGLVERTGIDASEVDDVIIGCAFPEGEQGMNFARTATMKAGLPIQVPAQTVNRFCSSGIQSIANAAERIMAGFADCIVAGGAESMSMVPMGVTSTAPIRLWWQTGQRATLRWGSPPNLSPRNTVSIVMIRMHLLWRVILKPPLPSKLAVLPTKSFRSISKKRRSTVKGKNSTKP